jgi:ATP-dependent helicase/nuclease subunit B
MLHDFAERHSESLPADIEAELIEAADRALSNFGDDARATAFWRPQFRRFARWFAATELSRRARLAKTHAEIDGSHVIGVGDGFELTARADRIDILSDGSAAIYDYKTGKPPSEKWVLDLLSPQPPLEAAIPAKGGSVAGRVSRAASLTSTFPDDWRAATSKTSPTQQRRRRSRKMRAGKSHEADRHFNNPDTPHEVKRRSSRAFEAAYRYDPYEQLARQGMGHPLQTRTRHEPRHGAVRHRREPKTCVRS